MEMKMREGRGVKEGDRQGEAKRGHVGGGAPVRRAVLQWESMGMQRMARDVERPRGRCRFKTQGSQLAGFVNITVPA